MSRITDELAMRDKRDFIKGVSTKENLVNLYCSITPSKELDKTLVEMLSKKATNSRIRAYMLNYLKESVEKDFYAIDDMDEALETTSQKVATTNNNAKPQQDVNVKSPTDGHIATFIKNNVKRKFDQEKNAEDKSAEITDDGYGFKIVRKDGGVLTYTYGDGFKNTPAQKTEAMSNETTKKSLNEVASSLGRFVGARVMTQWTVSLLVYGAEESPDYDYEQSFTGYLDECIDKLDEYDDIINDNNIDGYLTLESERGSEYYEGDADSIKSDLEDDGLLECKKSDNKGVKLIEDAADNINTYGEDKDVIFKVKRVQDEVYDRILEGSNADLMDNIKNIFADYGGHCVMYDVRPTSFIMEGWLPSNGVKLSGRTPDKWTFRSTFIMSYLYSDANMLAEDIARWYYVCQLGGTKVPNTPELVKLVDNFFKIDWNKQPVTESKKDNLSFEQWVDHKFYPGFHEGLSDLTDDEYYELEDAYNAYLMEKDHWESMDGFNMP